MIRNAIDSYNKYKLAYLNVVSSNIEEKDYKCAQFKAIINYLKLKKDEAMPTHVVDLRVRYTEIKARKPLTMREFLTNEVHCTEENINIFDRLLAPVVPAESSDDLLDEIEDMLIQVPHPY